MYYYIHDNFLEDSLFALYCFEYEEMRLDASHQRSIVPQSSTYAKNFTIHTAENI